MTKGVSTIMDCLSVCGAWHTNEEVASLDAAVSNCFAHRGFVSIHLRRINMPISTDRVKLNSRQMIVNVNAGIGPLPIPCPKGFKNRWSSVVILVHAKS